MPEQPTVFANSPDSLDSVPLSRRSFFKLTAAGSAGVVGAGLSGCSSADQTAAPGYQFLSIADMELIRALQPVILENAVAGDSQETADSIFQLIDGTLFLASDANRQAVRDLLNLLHMRLGRWLSTSVWSNWPEAQPAEVLAFLDGWQNSRFEMINAGYRLLTKLIAGSYYGLPISQPSSGYPGPPVWAKKALNTANATAAVPAAAAAPNSATDETNPAAATTTSEQ